MKDKALYVTVSLLLIACAFVAGQIVSPHLRTVKAGLPGGGHFCCWKPGTWYTIPSCGPPVQLNPQNLPSHCSCAPIQLWC